MKGFRVLALILLLFPLLANAQTGTLKGVVSDSLNKEPLIGVTVKIEGAGGQGQVTDIDGKFSFSRIDPGKYTVTFTYLSYKTLTLKDVKVAENAITTLDVGMQPATQELQNVVISATRNTGTQKAVIEEIKNAENVVNGVSSDQIKQSQDRDAGQVMSRVPGVTIVENRFVMVRGLPERYNQVMINNVIAPSTEVDRRTFSFDLIPSNVLDRMMIYKSGMADNPGDFAGGLTKIYTQNRTDNDFISFSLSSGFRSGTTFSDFENAPGGNATDLLGFDSKRGLPDNFPTTADIKAAPRRSELRQTAGRLLENNFETQQQTAMPNMGGTLNFGKNWKLGKSEKKLSTVGAINYSQSQQYYVRDFHRYFSWEKEDRLKGIPIQDWFDYKDHSYEKENRVGLISNWQLKLNAFNKIDFRNLYNQIGENTTVIREGMEYQQFSGKQRRNYMLGYRGRSIYNGQAEGTHTFSRSRASLTWILGMNYLSENEPDLRRFRTVQPGKEEFQMILPPSSNLFDAGRYYGNLRESGYSHMLNFDKALGKSDDGSFTIRAGYMIDYRKREFAARYVSYLYPGTNDPTIGEEIKKMPLSTIFAPENLKMVDGLVIEEGTRNIDQYSASNLLGAGYVSTQIKRGDFTVNAGLRAEYNVQKLNSMDDAGKPLNVNNPILSPLGFLNVGYHITEKQTLRFAYGRTVNRPEFRELAPFVFYDFKMDASKVGNPNLQTCTINNFDLRYEIYPRDGEMLSIGTFYKNFINPIETQIFVMTEQPGLGYTNAESAYNYGVEVEIRKSMQGVTSSNFLNRFSLNLNASLIKSQVSYSDTVVLAQDSKRALQGQSPFIINAGLEYNHSEAGLQVSAGYNIFGERIYAVGSYLFPTIYELPRHALDVTVSKKLSKTTTLKVGVQDALNARYRFYQDSDISGKADVSIDHPIFTYRRGALYTATFTFKF
jgi:hypothetical protein